MKGTKEDPIELKEIVVKQRVLSITFDQLKQIVPDIPKNGDVFVPYLNKVITEFEINTPKRLAAFIAQIAHESGGFRHMREIASGATYDTGRKAKQLGNTPQADGDGQFYKGRSPMQITGKANYKACSLFLFGDERLLKTPELLELPEFAIRASAWYFVIIKGNSLMDLPDSWRSATKKYSPFQYLTYRINTALLHYDRRLAYFKKGLQALS